MTWVSEEGVNSTPSICAKQRAVCVKNPRSYWRCYINHRNYNNKDERYCSWQLRNRTYAADSRHWASLCTFRAFSPRTLCTGPPGERDPRAGPHTQSSTLVKWLSRQQNCVASCWKWGRWALAGSSCIRAFSEKSTNKGSCNFETLINNELTNLECKEEAEEQYLKLALRLPWVWSVSDFIILAWNIKAGGQSSPSPSHLPTDSLRPVYSS